MLDINVDCSLYSNSSESFLSTLSLPSSATLLAFPGPTAFSLKPLPSQTTATSKAGSFRRLSSPIPNNSFLPLFRPHPLADIDTPQQTAAIFYQSGVRSLSVSDRIRSVFDEATDPV
ncbi:hypothetical protein K435DRAFT_864493 [Dendrothele bispora CBS 962.96]|uniref:Uncharacterized protein n=1 Tax=Dendrothele bispora (strain CBS 962.96) TaxID=1314807 RepID=A0A4S8LN84_DENBC|nr:hypothetical protein K435DRAFT_864493 [Dendrothele bispora CBS 962.96]